MTQMQILVSQCQVAAATRTRTAPAEMTPEQLVAHELLTSPGMTQKQLMKAIGKAETTTENAIRANLSAGRIVRVKEMECGRPLNRYYLA